MLKAVTFDFWDTIVADGTDEPKRADAGEPPKAVAQRRLFVQEVSTHHPELPLERINAAFDHMNQWFVQAWKVGHHTPHISERVLEGYRHLGIMPSPGFDHMVQALARMEVVFLPDLAPGIIDCLAVLKDRYKLGIISDTITSPGTSLREMLERYGLKDCFDALIFSDEVGASKPAPAIFAAAMEALGLDDPAQLAHVGDREANDIAGPLAFGAHAVLYTGIKDRGSHNTKASGICAHHRDLPALLASF